MIAVLGGLGAAVCFTISALCASASSRAIGAQSTLAWVMLIGLVLILPPTVLLADPAQLTWPTVGLLAVAGASGVAGLLIEYVAFRRGKVGVVTGIASTEGMVAALISAAAGARLHARTGLLLALVTVGVAVTAASPDQGQADADPGGPGGSGGPGGRTVRAAVLALPVALLFGLTLYTTGRIGARASVLWALLPARLDRRRGLHPARPAPHPCPAGRPGGGRHRGVAGQRSGPVTFQWPQPPYGSCRARSADGTVTQKAD